MLRRWSENKHDWKRINGRKCHGLGPVEAEDHYWLKENHFIVEDSSIKSNNNNNINNNNNNSK